jgi:hypothetical protein
MALAVVDGLQTVATLETSGVNREGCCITAVTGRNARFTDEVENNAARFTVQSHHAPVAFRADETPPVSATSRGYGHLGGDAGQWLVDFAVTNPTRVSPGTGSLGDPNYFTILDCEL